MKKQTYFCSNEQHTDYKSARAGGRLLTIKNSSDCTGRSNIEFEEKFQYFVDAVINNKPYVTFSDMYGVDIWINNLTTNNGGKFPTDFTLTQRNEYLNYVNQSQQAHLGTGYGCPVDTSMSIPNTVIAIIVNSACQ